MIKNRIYLLGNITDLSVQHDAKTKTLISAKCKVNILETFKNKETGAFEERPVIYDVMFFGDLALFISERKDKIDGAKCLVEAYLMKKKQSTTYCRGIGLTILDNRFKPNNDSAHKDAPPKNLYITK